MFYFHFFIDVLYCWLCFCSELVVHSFLTAKRDIKEGEEITWCYGTNYKRDYPTSCPSYREEKGTRRGESAANFVVEP